MYLPSNGAIADIAHCALGLCFQGYKMWNANIRETVRVSENASVWLSFRHLMGPLIMLCSMTFTKIVQTNHLKPLYLRNSEKASVKKNVMTFLSATEWHRCECTRWHWTRLSRFSRFRRFSIICNVYISELMKVSAKMRLVTFIDVEIRLGMASLRMMPFQILVDIDQNFQVINNNC